jgi:tetratricopeptide (TPR) repeat protein
MLKRDVPSSPAAYQSYLRANEVSRDSAQWLNALELFERCTAADPYYAPGWAGVGRMQRMLGKYLEHDRVERLERAERALKRALELNPDHGRRGKQPRTS